MIENQKVKSGLACIIFVQPVFACYDRKMTELIWHLTFTWLYYMIKRARINFFGLSK